ncbi:SPOSA6832_01772, partial [Sporobolomyces salmonicolor]
MTTKELASAASWESQTPTPAEVSPVASAAVSRSPTLVDLPRPEKVDDVPPHPTAPAFANISHEHHLDLPHLHLPHPHLPPHPHQHLEQYFPPDNYESLDQIAQEKETAQQGADSEKGGTETPAAGVDDYPDGGLRAWLVVAGAWSVSFATWGYINSSSDIAWIGAFQIAAVLFTAVLAGKAFDAGYVKYLMVAGLLIYTAGLFGLSYANTYAEFFLAQGVACGLASGLLFLPACSAVSHFFKKKRSLALGFLATGSSLGGVMFPSMTNKLLYTVRAIRNLAKRSLLAAGFIVVALLLFACFAITTRLPPRKSGRIVDFGVFKDIPFTTYTLGSGFIWLGLYMPIFYTEEYALYHGIRQDIAFYSLSILNAASLFGRTIPNYFADSYGALTVLIPSCTVSGIFIFCWIAMVKSEAGLICFCIFFGEWKKLRWRVRKGKNADMKEPPTGFSQGTFVSMLPASVASLTPNMSEIGIRLAMNFLFQSPFALTGTPMSGGILALHSGQSGYTIAACVAGAFVLLGTTFIALARSMVSKRKGTPWV